ncbi:MAG: acriflavin resistance protein [Francisellaceae bacterium]|nr:acriflavin resistance protein [Francisellaceae bacterium]
MNFTDIFIKRPVLAMVVSLLILTLGLRSVNLLSIRQYPETQNAVVTITTVYTGADPDLIAGFITTPIENSVAQANGIDYLTSKSTENSSVIQANLRLNYDPNKALTEINTKVNAVLNQLPSGTLQPIITIAIGETLNSMYIGFNSKVLATNKITDYLIRVVQPILQAVPGVQQAGLIGARNFAMRIWLDPMKLSAFSLTPSDIASALSNNNFISAVGRTDGDMITVNLNAHTGLNSVHEFENLIIKKEKNSLVRLKQVANISLGAEDYNSVVQFDNQEAVYIGIQVAPSANLLKVIEKIKEIFPGIQESLPKGLNAAIVYDATKFVNNSITEVEHSLIEALLIVTAVIFLFLGSIRSVSIPVIAIPLSLVGTFFIMLLFGFSINLLTLLALVLAIGLVVDDAIIVVENVHRHMEDGLSAFKASLLSAKELFGPILSISIVLIAVYIPIGFMGGLTGALFTEFAFTLAGAVGISAIVALTLTPMMCSKLMKPQTIQGRFTSQIDYYFDRLSQFYQNKLSLILNDLRVVVVFSVIILSSIYFLYTHSKTELAPQEDQGVLISLLTTAPSANLTQTQLYTKQLYHTLSEFKETQHVFQLDGINGLNSGIAGMVLKPWNERNKTTNELQPLVQALLNKIAGANTVLFQPPSLPGGGGGLPLQVVLKTTDSFDKLNIVNQSLLNKLQESGLFMFLDTDLKYDKPQTFIKVDREKAALLGLSMKEIGNNLGYALGGGYINYFNFGGRAYKVIPQMARGKRLNDSQLLNYPITTENGSSINLSTIASLETQVIPESLNHFQQLNSATLSGVLFPGLTLGEALQSIKTLAKEILPENYNLDYAGQSRQFQQESNALLITFIFAMIIIFLALSAQFESFRDPLIVLISVPMSICGALLFICVGVGGATLNIYTEVGLITLIGLISKHGILIVQFANQLRKEGLNKRQAIESAAKLRLRPILMTTAAMVLGIFPLLIATGAGAASRFSIGLVITAGLSIGTLFTLFVVPAMYLLLSEQDKALKNIQ